MGLQDIGKISREDFIEIKDLIKEAAEENEKRIEKIEYA